MWRDAEKTLAAAEKGAGTLKNNGYAVLLINGDKDRPDAFRTLAEKLKLLGIHQEVEVLKDTPHNLGLYYERAGEKMVEFLGKQLKE